MLYGREAERARLERLLGEARDGNGGALLVRGEAGIGKSALLADAVAGAEGMLTLEATCFQSETRLAFATLATLLQPVLEHLDELSEPEAAALQGALALGPAHSVEHFAVSAAALALLTTAARHRPVLVVVDDVQWIDSSSADTLAFIAGRTQLLPLAVLLAERGESGPAGSGALSRWPMAEELPLDRLDREASLALLEPRAMASSVADGVASAADGNPLALVELAAALSDRQREGAEPLTDPLPTSRALEGLFGARIADLPASAGEALLLAAACEPGVGATLAGALAERGLAMDALEPAEADGVVDLRPGRVEFRHPLARSAVYQGATPADRRAAHTTLAAHAGEEARAWHLAAAAIGPDEPSAHALEEVAESALSRGAPSAAAEALEHAAVLSPQPGPALDRRMRAAQAWIRTGQLERAARLLETALPDASGPVERAEVQRQIAETMLLSGRLTEGHDLLVREAARVEDDHPVLAARMLADAGVAHMARGDAIPLEQIARRALALAREGGGEVLVPSVQLAEALIVQGRHEEARGLLEGQYDALLAADPLGPENEILAIAGLLLLWLQDFERAESLLTHLTRTARDAGARRALALPLGVQAAVYTWKSELPDAVAAAREAVELAEETGAVFALAFALGTVSIACAWRGQEDECREAARRSLELGQAVGLKATMLYSEASLGLLELGLGNTQAAIDCLERARMLGKETGITDPGFLVFEATLIEGYIQERRLDEARALIEELKPAAAGSSAQAMAGVVRCEGLAAPDGEYEQYFERALELHEEGADPLAVADTELRYGERLRRDRRRVDARKHLAAALAIFERTGAEPWASRARAELAATGGGKQSAESVSVEAPGVELTEQERKVTELVIAGATNREVAAQLYLSPRTVEHHLGQVYRKLGVRSRTELAALLRTSV